MPRKTKDAEKEVKVNKKVNSKSSTKKTTSKKSPLKEKSTVATKSTAKPKKTVATSKTKKVTTTKTKKSTAKTADKKATTTKAKKSTSKATDKKATTTKTKKSTAKTADKKVATTKTKKSTSKATDKKSTTKAKKNTTKSTSKKTTTAKVKKATKKDLEYYDLPYRYNETTVKILAQTPKKLFIYWDIADADREKYIKEFGNDFFNNTKPVLIIHNDTLNYTFEVEINDFANCWYLDINDSKAKYTIELGRRSKVQNYNIPNNYIFVADSNIIESPNDHILFEKQSKTIYFRNVKNNNTYSKDITDMSFIRRIGKIYNIYDAYRNLYSEMYEDNFDFDLNNPTSNNPTSTFK